MAQLGHDRLAEALVLKQFRDLGPGNAEAGSLREQVDRMTTRAELAEGLPTTHAQLKTARAKAAENEESSSAWAEAFRENYRSVIRRQNGGESTES